MATPQVGISPASAETERTQVKTTVNTNRFIGLTPCLRKNHVNPFASAKIRTIRQHFLQGEPERTISPSQSLNFLRSESLDTHADDLAEAPSEKRSVRGYCLRCTERPEYAGVERDGCLPNCSSVTYPDCVTTISNYGTGLSSHCWLAIPT